MKQTEAFRVLASADRQLVLHTLVERGREVTVEELSRQVAARRHRLAPEQIDDQQVERARVRLVHTHFPHLVERNVVEIDWSERVVTLSDDECLGELFDAAEELDGWPPTDLLEQPSS
ncbi:hypothetical protein OB955_08485 [Halobacteria archaeon AArc-m2/3/4]|uniref:DUF7344 domain-containing protein n=1 Tax=Natronoglomus mannanivorans TaxID=2979990 RepID=A0ABT2QCW7_9EURY|nr:hypothetical protein [Halobacteria archaeon AArc-m2/3/4]